MEVLIMKYTLKDKKDHVDNATTFKGTTLEYCRLNNLSPATFYKWKKEFSNDTFIDITDEIKTNNSTCNLTLNIKDILIIVADNYYEELLLKVLTSIGKI